MVDMGNPTVEILTAMANGQIDPEMMSQFQAYYQGHHSESSQMPTMPPQRILDTSSWTRPYGSYQFRIFWQAYTVCWDQGKTRSMTLEIMKSMCGTETEEDMMIMFAAHAMHFFQENSLPIDPKEEEEEFVKVQEAVASGVTVPTNA